MSEWKPMEKCYKCPYLLAVFAEKETRFRCGKGAMLTVPYQIVALWERHKDEIPDGSVDCPGVQEPKIEPLSPPEASAPLKDKLKQDTNVRAWPLNYGDVDEDTCPKCFSGDMRAVKEPSPELAARGMKATEEFSYTLYQLLRCNKCGHEEYILLSKVPRRYWKYRRDGNGPKEEGQTA